MYIDLHCHPSLKPFGKSFNLRAQPKQNINDTNNPQSIWFEDNPNLATKIIERKYGFPKYTQSDMSKLIEGDCRIVCVSLYPIEKGFFNLSDKHDWIADIISSIFQKIALDENIASFFSILENFFAWIEPIVSDIKNSKLVPKINVINDLINSFDSKLINLKNKAKQKKEFWLKIESSSELKTMLRVRFSTLIDFILEVGNGRVQYIRNMNSYYQDLVDEYNFYKQLNQSINTKNSKKRSYTILNTFQESTLLNSDPNKKEIGVIITIEGGHVFNSDISSTINPNQIIDNLEKVLNWEHPPFFITLSHHFFNNLCGHAESMSPPINQALDQDFGINTGITPLGYQFLDKLRTLNKSNVQRKRVYVDIKHMSILGRYQYYQYLNKIGTFTTTSPEFMKNPIIISHGSVTGLKSFNEPIYQFSDVENQFFEDDINFFDDEIIMMAKSNGIFGLQLDERRIGSKSKIDWIKEMIRSRQYSGLKGSASLLFDQMRHIARVLDKEGLSAWDFCAIGSDFDGIIDALPEINAADKMLGFEPELQAHIQNYINQGWINELSAPNNRNLTAEQITKKILFENANRFLQRYFQ